MDEKKMAVIVFSFPEPEDSLELGAIIVEAKKFFEGRDNIKIRMAINNAADQIVSMFDPIIDENNNLVQHAKRELVLTGNDEDFNRSLVNAVRAFASYGHSGGSASIAIPMLNELLYQRNLTPLTDNPDEWGTVGDDEWQSRRNSEAFSTDRGKTYYLLSERDYEGNPKRIHHSEPYVKEENGSGTEPNS